MKQQDIQDVDQILDEAAMTSTDTKTLDLPEAPASATVKFWIKGYGVLFTMRDEKANPLLRKVSMVVDYAESHGWKNTWEKDGNGVAKATTKADPDSCSHQNVGQKKASGHNKPENKDRVYNYCLDCNKFMGWKEGV